MTERPEPVGLGFDAFAEKSGIAVLPVDEFDGYLVTVAVPAGWDPFDAELGMRVWLWRGDPCIERFGANAVLTMHRIDEAVGADDVFAMLSDQQAGMVPSSDEVYRGLVEASDGPGFAGSLALNVPSQLGTIGSVSLSRIITRERDTLLAQLTVTALRESPVEWTAISLHVTRGAAAGSVTGSAPVENSRA